jgi:UDP-N-acetyl-2-amino-2-deoxyglucuronate dehydrogenase
VTTAAVIGCGDVSIVHLEAIEAIADGELIAVCDTDPATAAAVATGRGVRQFTDHRELLRNSPPDVVHICTPHDQHVQVLIDCVQAGVAVLVEKPLANTLAEAERVIAAVDAVPSVPVGVCFQNRYNQTAQAVKRLLQAGELGAVLGGTAIVSWSRTPAYYRARPWRGQASRSGGGVLINQAIHTLDLMQWLLGDVAAVSGQVGCYLLDGVIDVEDTAAAVLTHSGGARSVFFATNAGVVDSPVSIEIATERATLVIRQDLTISWADGRVETVAERRAASGGRGYWGVSHRLLIEDFYNRLNDPAPFWINPREALKSQRLLDQLYRLSS